MWSLPTRLAAPWAYAHRSSLLGFYHAGHSICPGFGVAISGLSVIYAAEL